MPRLRARSTHLKNFPATLASVARKQGVDGGDIEIWFGDEARIGQKNKITRRWARRGTRPSAPQDLRTASAYIFGAICPAEGKAAGLILPWCNTEAMNLQLAAISAKVAPGRHAVLLLDQAGWHLTPQLDVPANISIVPLPAKCPELNPQENVWEFMRDNWLSNRIFTCYENLVDHCCHAWNKLVEQPWTVMSIGLRDWERFNQPPLHGRKRLSGPPEAIIASHLAPLPSVSPGIAVTSPRRAGAITGNEAGLKIRATRGSSGPGELCYRVRPLATELKSAMRGRVLPRPVSSE